MANITRISIQGMHCNGCVARVTKALESIAAVEGVLVPDPRARLAGRGAWVHPDPACLDLAVRRRAFARALRSDVAPDVTAVRAEIDRRTGARPDPSADAGYRHPGWRSP